MLEARGIAYPGAAVALYQGFDLTVAPDEWVASAPLGLRQDHPLPPACPLRAPQTGGSSSTASPCRGAVRAPCRSYGSIPRPPWTRACAWARPCARRARPPVGCSRRPRHPAPLAVALSARAVRRRAAALLHRPRAGRGPALPRGRRDVHHARRAHAGPDMARPRGRDEQAGHRARVRVAFPRPHRPHSHARRAPGRVGPGAFPFPRPFPLAAPSSLPDPPPFVVAGFLLNSRYL